MNFGLDNNYSEFEEHAFGLNFLAPLLQTHLTKDHSKSTDKIEKRANNNAIDTAIRVATLKDYHGGALPMCYFSPLFNGGRTNPYAYAVRHMCTLTMYDLKYVKYLKKKIFVIDAYNGNFEPFALTHDHPFMEGSFVGLDGGGKKIGSFSTRSKDEDAPAVIDGHLLLKCDPFWLTGFCFGVSSDKGYAIDTCKTDYNPDMDFFKKKNFKFPAFLKSLKEIDSKCDALAGECDNRIEFSNTLISGILNNEMHGVVLAENPTTNKILRYKRRVQKLQHLVKEAIQNYDKIEHYEKMRKERDANTTDKALGKKRARE